MLSFCCMFSFYLSWTHTHTHTTIIIPYEPCENWLPWPKLCKISKNISLCMKIWSMINSLALFFWLRDKCWNVINVTRCLWQRKISNQYTARIPGSKPYLRLPSVCSLLWLAQRFQGPWNHCSGVFIRDIGPAELDAFRLGSSCNLPIWSMSDFAVLDCSKDCWKKAMSDSPPGSLRFQPVVSDYSGPLWPVRPSWVWLMSRVLGWHMSCPLILKCFSAYFLQTRTLFYIPTVYLTNSGNLKVLQ